MEDIAGLFQDAVGVTIRVGGPMLLLSMVVGVVTAILQAVTQIHEQTISFIMKLIVVVLFLILGGSWMMTTIQEYAIELFELMKA